MVASMDDITANQDEVQTAVQALEDARDAWVKRNPLRKLRLSGRYSTDGKGMNKNQFAAFLRVSPMSVGRWETTNPPEDEYLTFIAEGLAVDRTELFEAFKEWYESAPQLSDFLGDKKIVLE